jgi:4-amino-4-deoxy-L-arabinose transferase-like glycosyltransferase
MILESIVLLAGINLLLILAGLVWGSRHLTNPFKKIDRKIWILLLVILLSGTTLRFMTPWTHVMYIDEYWNMEAAQGILTTFRPELCEYTGYEEISCRPYPKLVGVPLLISISFLINGVSSQSAILVNIILGSLSVLLMFSLAYLATGREDTALFSALILAVYPAYIMWSGSAETIITGIFFLLLTLNFFLLYFRTGSWCPYFLGVLSLAFLLQTRLEYLIMLPLAVVMHFIFEMDIRKIVRDYRFWVTWSVFLLFLIPYSIQLTNYLDMFLTAIYEHSPYFQFTGQEVIMFADALFLVSAGLLLIASIVAPRTRAFAHFRGKSLIFLLVLFLTFLMFSGFSYSKVLLSAIIPAIVLISILITRLIVRLRKLAVMHALLAILVLVFFFPYVHPFYSEPSMEVYLHDAYVLESRALESIKEIQYECYVITRQPSALAITSLKPVSLSTVLNNPQAIEDISRNAECLMFYEDLDCFLEEKECFFRNIRVGAGGMIMQHQDCFLESPISECEAVKQGFNSIPYRTFSLGNLTYTLYKLSA